MDSQTNDSPQGLEFVSLLHSVLHRIRSYTAEQLRPSGLAPGQYRFLHTLSHSSEPMRMVDIANRLNIAQRSVTSKVQDAEREGLVIRSVDPKDKRASLVALTTAGEQLLTEVNSARGAHAAELLGVLTMQERAQLLQLLHKIGQETA